MPFFVVNQRACAIFSLNVTWLERFGLVFLVWLTEIWEEITNRWLDFGLVMRVMVL
jgi:hypothetical protein